MGITNDCMHIRRLGAAIAFTIMLWSPASGAGDGSGGRLGDADLSCAQIAQELQPYMQRMMPAVAGLGQSAQEMKNRSEKRQKEAAAMAAEQTARQLVAAADPTGRAGAAVNMRNMAEQQAAARRIEAEDKPLSDKAMAQGRQVVQQGQALQSDARLQRLLQLAQDKNCQ